MMKILIIIAVAVLLLVAAGVWGVRYMMGQPIYRPGTVQRGEKLGASLDPPARSTATEWSVERRVMLHYFDQRGDETGIGETEQAGQAGADAAPVLVLHGGPGFPFRAPIAALDAVTDDHRILYYHQRGCGLSTKPFDRFASSNFYANMKSLETTLGLGAQIADIERVRRVLGVEKLTLVGHSFGGFLAALYAAEFPERVRALVLVAPADLLVLPPADDLFQIVGERLPADRQAAYRSFIADYLDFGAVFAKSEAELAASHRAFGEYYLAATGMSTEEITDALGPTGADANGGWMVTACYFSMGKRHDYRDALRAVTAPVLIIHGADDLVPPRVSESYAALLPNADVKIIPDAGHLVFDDQPQAFAEAITAFLE